MPRDGVATQTIPVSQARQRLGELINRVYRRQVRIIVEKSGIPVAALISLADLERWTHLDYESERAETVSTEAREEATKDPERVSHEGPTAQELDRRQALVTKILAASKDRVIAPLTTADLVHRVRKEQDRARAARRP